MFFRRRGNASHRINERSHAFMSGNTIIPLVSILDRSHHERQGKSRCEGAILAATPRIVPIAAKYRESTVLRTT